MRQALTFVLCLALCGLISGCSRDSSLEARTEDLPAFTITLPEGWATNIPDGLECTPDRCTAGFTHTPSGSRQAVTVSVMPNLGKELSAIVDESLKSMAANEVVMQVVMSTPERVEFKGTIRESQARLVATFDPAKSQIGVLLVVEENEETARVLQTLRMKNPKLDFHAR